MASRRRCSRRSRSVGGTRFATVTNGVVVFGLYGPAFIGSWVEQIGAHASNIAAATSVPSRA